MVAGQCGCSLHAAVAGYAVEVVLVALIPTAQAAIEPEAGLDRACADDMVALTGESLCSLILSIDGCEE